jgi:hypothetical protein
MYVQNISGSYNVDKKNIIKDFFNYIIRKRSDVLSCALLNFVENIMHFQDCKNTHYINYSLVKIAEFLLKDS